MADDLERVKNLVDFMRAEGIVQLILGKDLVHISLHTPPPDTTGMTGIAPERKATTSPAVADASTDKTASCGWKVLAPMTGTFHRAPDPQSPPYVEIGQKVAAGQPLCIIESMKMMYPIEAEKTGIVLAIHAIDAEVVNAEQPLFTLD